MQAADPEPARVVIAGGGVAAAEALLALRAYAGDRVAVTLVAPDEQLVYRPLAVTEPLAGRPARRYDLRAICDDLGAELHRGQLRAVDGARRQVVTDGDARIPYDALIVAVGARPRPVLPRAHTVFADGAIDDLKSLLADVEAGRARRLAFVVSVRSGWSLPIYELALQVARHAAGHGARDLAVTIVTPEEEPLAAFHGAGSEAVAQVLKDAGIAIRCSTYASDFDGAALTLMPGAETLPVDAVVALPDLAGPRLEGLPCDADGFIHVDEHTRVPGMDDVYAVGDATTFPIKQGGLATQEADIAAAHVARDLGADVKLPRTRPFLRALLLTGEEPLYLTATLTGGESVNSRASRQSMWWPPHKIAARHLAPYLADREPLATTPADGSQEATDG